MPSVDDLKPRFQALLRPLVRFLARRGATANQVTIAALAFSSFAGGLILLNPRARWTWLVMPLMLFIRMALNAIDGIAGA